MSISRRSTNMPPLFYARARIANRGALGISERWSPNLLWILDAHLLRDGEPLRIANDMKRNEYNHLYQTTKWRKIRSDYLLRNPLCVMCRQDGLYTPASVCDHIDPHKGNETKFYSGPFQALCKTHHDSTKAREEYRGVKIGGDVDGIPIDPQHHWNK